MLSDGYAQNEGSIMVSFIKQAIDEKIERDGLSIAEHSDNE